ncbi:DUF4421 family protein [Pareuzebyella sediminis]|uniref:DUF4421 family protein n=1 Tax=Pareuzebyella sediminis TaxID=2607998 RepID=UPI0011EC7CED|nr:DUF4421 family protein [Pareuzebyella sediminis]
MILLRFAKITAKPNIAFRQEIIFYTLPYWFVFVFCHLQVQAQQGDSLPNIVEDGHIEKMGDKLAMDISFNNAFETFQVNADNKIVLYPNASTNLYLHMSYRFISFGFKFAPDFLPGNGDEAKKGETKSFSLGTALIFKHWFGNVAYSKVRGYYIDNTSDYRDMKPRDPFIQFPDLHYNSFVLNFGYYNNPRFSFRSLTSQTERQLKSAGSFMPVLHLRYYTTNDESPVESSQKTNNFETTIGPGYAHTFVTNQKYYLSLGLTASAGYINTKLTTRLPGEDNISHQDNFIFRWDAKTGIGYNGSKFYTGLYASASGTQYKQQNTTVINFNNRLNYHLFFGIRIDAPDYLNRKVNMVEEKINSKLKSAKTKQSKSR